MTDSHKETTQQMLLCLHIVTITSQSERKQTVNCMNLLRFNGHTTITAAATAIATK